MINREARRKYRELVRQFISGRVTNDEYEEKFEQLKLENLDPAVDEIFHQVWHLYDDLSTHRMTGDHHLDKAGRRQIAQAVLFLQTENRYCWPQEEMWGCLLFLVLSASAAATVCVISLFPAWFLLVLSVSGCFCSVTTTFLLLKSRQEKRAWQKAGEVAAWPFQTQADLSEAKRHPRLLAGTDGS